MPKKFPEEFKRDVANVARRGDLTLAEVAHDCDVSVESVRRWVRQADIDDGIKDGLTTAEQSELVQLRRDKRRLEQEVEILRRATAYFAKDAAPRMMFPLVADLAAEGVAVVTTCGVLEFSPQAFYKWRARPCSDRYLDDAYVTNALVDAHGEDPEFGYRFLADELEIAGHRLGERRVWRLCRDQRPWSTTTKKGGRCAKGRPGPAVHDDLVQRVFSADAPDRDAHDEVTSRMVCLPHRVREPSAEHDARGVRRRERMGQIGRCPTTREPPHRIVPGSTASTQATDKLRSWRRRPRYSCDRSLRRCWSAQDTASLVLAIARC